MEKLIRLLLVSDDEDERKKIRLLTSGEATMVIGEARSGEEALAQAKKLSPDVVILPMHKGMPDRKVIDTTRAITEAQLPTKVIIITDNLTRNLAPAIKAGAAGILFEGISRDKLLSAIHKIHLWWCGPS